MKAQLNLSKKIMWEAIISCNPEYDGIFFYAVQTTGIFCRPSCKSKVPRYKNVSFFVTAADAERAGFRPCKRCRPDLLSKRYDPFESIVEDTKQLIKNNYGQKLLLQEIAQIVGVSRFHLNRLFKNRTGFTPHMFLEKIRIEKAKDLLLTSNLNCTQIAYQIGYQSLSSFYNAFKRNTGYSPSQYQKEYAKTESC